MTGIRSFNNSTCKTVLNLLKTGNLRLKKLSLQRTMDVAMVEAVEAPE